MPGAESLKKARWASLATKQAAVMTSVQRRRCSLALTLCLCACSLDSRHLSGAAGGRAAQSSGGSAGASGNTPDGGAGGAAASDLVDGCADLDTDGIADCTVTLVSNPSFTSDVSDWAPIGDANLSWDPQNALSDQPSGSAKLSSSTARASAVQCVALSGEQLVVAYANAFVDSGSDATPAQAELEVSFFESADCSGERTRYFETPANAATGAWTTIQAGGLSKATTSSVSIALLGFKAASASELIVYFDNLMLTAKAP
jgi:hypothetical protein